MAGWAGNLLITIQPGSLTSSPLDADHFHWGSAGLRVEGFGKEEVCSINFEGKSEIAAKLEASLNSREDIY